jgi:acrylyl-CoA reductase (NADPH)/3-hydroxypropionyl-CoA dehydratase/3-hydroxypropionyl-CoA synthetase
MRSAFLADPGAFHGNIAARLMHWFVPDVGAEGAWLHRDEDGIWSGWDAGSGEAVAPDLPADFAPWTTAFDGSDHISAGSRAAGRTPASAKSTGMS